MFLGRLKPGDASPRVVLGVGETGLKPANRTLVRSGVAAVDTQLRELPEADMKPWPVGSNRRPHA